MTEAAVHICLNRLGHREIFDSVDVDRGGTISAEELSQALSNRTSGEKLEGKSLEMVMKELDTDGKSCLNQLVVLRFRRLRGNLLHGCTQRTGIQLASV